MDSTFIEHKHNNLMKYQTLIRTTATLYLLMAVLGCTGTREAEEGFLQVDKKVISVAKTAIETRFTVSSTERRQLSKPNTGAKWITSIAADNGTSNASSITGENDAFITIMTTANPSSAGRSTKLTLRAIDQAGKALTYPTPVTISFTQVPTTHTGDISVTTQAQVDALRTSLTAGATRIVGNVTIGPEKGTSDISDLSPLASIIEITGNVVVRRNSDLPNLMGLNQLQSIGGNFEVSWNGSLTSLGDFPALQTIGGGFYVYDNVALTSLGDFTALQSIGGSFSVRNNVALTSLGDFTALQSIGGSFSVRNNLALTSLRDFPTLQAIGGHFEVRYNDVLTSLRGFPILTSIGSVDGIPVLSYGYDGREVSDVSIVVEYNELLQDCCVLTAFLSGATNAVSGQIFINNAPGCSSTTEVNCDPFLQVGKKVVFAAKATAEGTLEMFSTLHWQLSKPNTGAEWITNIAADGGNSDASSITGENDASITITTTVNPNDAGRSTTLTLRAIDQSGKALTDPTPVTIPFTQLGTTHTGDITLKSQSSVNAFPTNVTAIQGDLIIGGSNDITDLRPLSGITHVTGRVEVWGNSRLVSLSLLGNLQAIGSRFNVRGNNLLQDCCVLTAFLSGATNAVSGRISIYDNAPGCSSTTEVNCDPFLQVDQKVVFAAKTAGEGMFDLFSGQHWQLNKPNTGAEWITNIAADNGISDASSITGENHAFHAFITITTTANPNDAGRSTTLTLRAIDQAGNALTDPVPITIFFTQLGTTHTGSITLKSQSSINALTLPANATAIQGDLIIGRNNDITDLRPLSGITHVTGSVRVGGNSRLVSLDPLGNLQSIGGSFVVGGYGYGDGNASLTSLGDFTTLQAIGGRFEVSNNDTLTSLGGFPILASIGSADGISVSNTVDYGEDEDGVSIVVERNNRLQDCCVLTPFLSGATNAVSGQVFINNNATGCSSKAKIKPCAGSTTKGK